LAAEEALAVIIVLDESALPALDSQIPPAWPFVRLLSPRGRVSAAPSAESAAEPEALVVERRTGEPKPLSEPEPDLEWKPKLRGEPDRCSRPES